MFIEYFHNCAKSTDAGNARATKSNGTIVTFATAQHMAVEGARVRDLPYTVTDGRLSHAIATDDRGYREIFACAGQSAELTKAVADCDFDCNIL